jgi:hypothetical protein
MAKNDETEYEQTQAQKQAKIAALHEEAQARDPSLCSYSKDGKFCPNPKLYPKFEQVVNVSEPTPESRVGLRDEVVCFCETHQGVKRYALIAFASEEQATEFSKTMRGRGYAANVWQSKYVVIGPTSAPTLLLSAGNCAGHFENHMYEDVLMAAIERLGINLSHIMGRGSRQ